METISPKTSQFAIRYGLILGTISVIFGIILYSMDMHYQQDWKVGVVSMIIMIAVIFWGLSEYKKANRGFLSLSQALKIGVGISLISGIIGIVYQQLLMHVIDPEFMQKSMDFQKMMMQDRGMDPTQIDAAMEMGKKFQGPFIQVALGLIGSLFFGFVFSLITGLILKKSDPAS